MKFRLNPVSFWITVLLIAPLCILSCTYLIYATISNNNVNYLVILFVVVAIACLVVYPFKKDIFSTIALSPNGISVTYGSQPLFEAKWEEILHFQEFSVKGRYNSATFISLSKKANANNRKRLPKTTVSEDETEVVILKTNRLKYELDKYLKMQ